LQSQKDSHESSNLHCLSSFAVQFGDQLIFILVHIYTGTLKKIVCKDVLHLFYEY